MREVLARTRELSKVSAPPCLTSLTDGEKPRINPHPTLRTQPSGAATTNAVRGQSAQSLPVADVTERRYDPQKAGTKVGHMHDHFTVSAGRIRSSRPSLKGGCAFGSLGIQTIAGFGGGMLD